MFVRHTSPREPRRWKLAAASASVLTILTVAGLASVPAFATQGQGFAPSTISLGNLGPVDARADDKVSEQGQNNRFNHWDLMLKTSDQSDVGVDRLTVQSGGFSGWHSHAGPIVVTVLTGSITWYDGKDCSAKTYQQGQSFVEQANHPHFVANATNSTVELIAFTIRPDGTPGRIDAPAPATCQI
jgi:quercetin dioxygenase-like cupin family protein